MSESELAALRVKMATTGRGLDAYAALTDTYGASVRVQDSSAAESAHCWIFIDGGSVGNNDGGAHLTPAQAAEIALGLIEFWKAAQA